MKLDDYTYTEKLCGCSVVYLAESDYKTDRPALNIECKKHIGSHNKDARDKLIERGRKVARKYLKEQK